MNDEVLVSTFRTFLQMLGAVLSTLGIIQEAQWPLWSGLIMTTGSLGWMLWARWNTRKVSADAIVLPPPADPAPGDSAAQSSGRFLMLPVGLLAVGLFLGGCTQQQIDDATQKARSVYQATCAAYPVADVAFQGVVAALPPGKVPRRVIEAEAAAVAALAELCAREPANIVEASTAVARAYASALKALADARAAGR